MSHSQATRHRTGNNVVQEHGFTKVNLNILSSDDGWATSAIYMFSDGVTICVGTATNASPKSTSTYVDKRCLLYTSALLPMASTYCRLAEKLARCGKPTGKTIGCTQIGPEK